MPENWCPLSVFTSGTGCHRRRSSLTSALTTRELDTRPNSTVARSAHSSSQTTNCSLATRWGTAERSRARWTGSTSLNRPWTTPVLLQNSLRSRRHVSFCRNPAATAGIPFRPRFPPVTLHFLALPKLLPLSETRPLESSDHHELANMAHIDRAPLPIASFDSPSKFRSNSNNPFLVAGASRAGSPLKPQDQPRPPHLSFFKPQLQSRPSAPAFRNPAFTTPQKRRDEPIYSEYSGAESSPALTDTSEVPADTPEVEHTREDLGRVSFTPATGRTLFSQTLLRNHASGKGEIAKANRDKVRKRKRLPGDKDVGSGRSRLPHGSEDSDSDWEDPSRAVKGGRKGKTRSWANNFLSAVSNHPSAPAILSKWLQLGVNVVLLSLVLFGIFAILAQIRSDLSHASEKARTAIVNEMALCSDNYIKNACAPRGNRPPALDGPCNEWEACMHQDASAIMVGQISARNMAEIMNEFVGVLTFKTWVSQTTISCWPHPANHAPRVSSSRSSWWRSSLATSALGSSANLL